MIKKLLKKILNKLYNIINPCILIGDNCGIRVRRSLKCDKVSKIRIKNINTRNNCHIEAKRGGLIEIGENVNINYNCIISSHNRIKIGDNCLLGPNVIIYDHDHNYKNKNWRNEFTTKEIEIGNNVWIGGNVVILKGTKIEDNSVIAAGSILKGEQIKPNHLVFCKTELKVKEIERE